MPGRASAACDRLEAAVAGLDDRRLATLVGLFLFVTVAWPVLFLQVPPYQDLPGHLATVTILAHPERYPDFVSNGWLKSNEALIAWIFFAGKLPGVGLEAAARLFVLGTLAATALVLPRFVLHFTDRRRMLVAAPFAWPMVHNWFVSMGMLNFALGVALALAMLVLLDRQRAAPSIGRAAALVGLGVLTWYSSSVPLLFVGLLVAIEIVVQPSWGERLALARRLLPPLVPVGVLVALVVLRHAAGTGGARYGAVGSASYEAPIWLVYDAWSFWFYGFTELEASTLLVALVLAAVAVVRARERVRFFSVWALLALLAWYALMPFMLPGFGYVNARVLPFLWMAALLRLPRRLPRFVWEAACVAGVAYAVGLGVDMFRVSADLDAYTAGMGAVPEGSRLLALTFRTRLTAKNVWSLRHASGMYVVERRTSAQDVWADSPTMPLRFRQAPPFFEDQLRVERFLESVETRDRYCADQERAGLAETGDCAAEWRGKWDWLWREASAKVDRVLLFGPTPDVLSTVPPTWSTVFRRGPLVVLVPARGEPAP